MMIWIYSDMFICWYGAAYKKHLQWARSLSFIRYRVGQETLAVGIDRYRLFPIGVMLLSEWNEAHDEHAAIELIFQVHESANTLRAPRLTFILISTSFHLRLFKMFIYQLQHVDPIVENDYR